MLSQLEQACKTYSVESSSELIEFNSKLQRIFVTALLFLLDQAIPTTRTPLLAVDKKEKLYAWKRLKVKLEH